MSARHSLLINETPWAGPTAFRTAGADTLMGRGRRLKSPPGPLAYELRVDPKAKRPTDFPPLDWHNGPNGQALFSPRMLRVLSDVGVDTIDTYEASVVYAPTGESVPFKVGNVIGIASVLDRARSTFNADADGFIIELLRIAIDDALCGGRKLFRLLERPSVLVISAEVKAALEANGVTGTMIIEPAEWQPGLI